MYAFSDKIERNNADSNMEVNLKKSGKFSKNVYGPFVITFLLQRSSHLKLLIANISLIVKSKSLEIGEIAKFNNKGTVSLV